MPPSPNPVLMPEFKPLCAEWKGHQGLLLPNFPHPIPLMSHGRSELARVLCSLCAASALPRATLPSPGSSTQSTVCLSLKTLFLSYLLEETFPPCPRTQAPGLSPRLPCTHTPTLLACLTPILGAHLSLCSYCLAQRRQQCRFQTEQTSGSQVLHFAP